MNIRKNFEKEIIKKYIWLGAMWFITHFLICASIVVSLGIFVMIPISLFYALLEPYMNENIEKILIIPFCLVLLSAALYVAGYVATDLKWKREEKEESSSTDTNKNDSRIRK